MRFAYFMGYVCTANDDGSIPLNSRVVAGPAPLPNEGLVMVKGDQLTALLNGMLEGRYPPAESFITSRSLG